MFERFLIEKKTIEKKRTQQPMKNIVLKTEV